MMYAFWALAGITWAIGIFSLVAAVNSLDDVGWARRGAGGWQKSDAPRLRRLACARVLRGLACVVPILGAAPAIIALYRASREPKPDVNKEYVCAKCGTSIDGPYR